MRHVTLSLLATLAVTLTVGGCITKDEYEEGVYELRSSLNRISLDRGADGSAHLEFEYHYELGIIDEAGVEEVRWRYALITPDRLVLSDREQRMRRPQFAAGAPQDCADTGLSDNVACCRSCDTLCDDRRLNAELCQADRRCACGTDILVQGDRQRSLDVPAGTLNDAQTYLLWISISYRDEVVGEFFERVEDAFVTE